MEIYSKIQDPLSPSNKKIGGENVEFKSKCLKICQEAALFWLTHGLLDFWTRTHEDYFVIEDSIEKIMVKIVITSILKFWGIMLKCFVFLCQNLWCISV